jgi:hypothetical protein
VLDPLKQTVDPIVQPVKDTVDPVISPVVDPVKQTIDPVAKPVVDLVKETPEPLINPVVDPVNSVVGSAVDPAIDPSAAAAPVQHSAQVIVPYQQPSDNAFNRTPDPTRAPIEALVVPAQQTTGPVLKPAALHPAQRSESSVLVAPVLDERPLQTSVLDASGGSFVPQLADAVQIPSGASPAGVLSGNLSASSSSHGWLGARQILIDPLFSARELSSLFDHFVAAATTAPDSRGGALSLPFSGTAPAPVSGSSSSGAGASSGGSGLGTVVLLLGITALAGRLMLFSRKFLKPNSAYELIVNQPG